MTQHRCLSLCALGWLALLWTSAPVAGQEVAAPAADPQPTAAEPAPPTAAATAAPAASAETPPPAATSTGPAIELPPEATVPTTTTPIEQGGLQFGVTPKEDSLLRGLSPQRLTQPGTVIGGYGQFGLNAVRAGANGRFESTANVERVVLFVAHQLTDDIRIYTEFEWEDALACRSCGGSAEIEQAFVQWRLLGDLFALRVGLVLVPMGIINQWHEPPVFNGVNRPMVDQVIIPSTWRELGAGFVGNWQQLVRYELYLTTTLNPLSTQNTGGLTEQGLVGTSSLGSLARAKAFAVMGRAEVEPLLGVIAGASFFLSNVGPNGDYFKDDADHTRRHIAVPVLGYSLDARMRRSGFEARVVWAQFFLPNSDALLTAFHKDGSPLFPPLSMTGTLPERIQGGYLELAYNVFALTSISHELLGFVRLEYYNTQASVPTGYSANPALDVRELTMGLTYRPITQLVFKTDVQLRDRRLGLDEIQYNLGFGYMF